MAVLDNNKYVSNGSIHEVQGLIKLTISQITCIDTFLMVTRGGKQNLKAYQYYFVQVNFTKQSVTFHSKITFCYKHPFVPEPIGNSNAKRQCPHCMVSINNQR